MLTRPIATGHLLYQVPESRRAFRDALRRAAVHLGYGLLQQGVLIAMDDRTDQLGPLARRSCGGPSRRYSRSSADPPSAT
jgi:DNA-binding transcriptional regulator PaaX